MTGAGMGMKNAIVSVASDFADLEDASTRLKSVMMDRNGMAGAFEEVNALAVKLV
jgi:hypothetical protein